MIHEFETEEAAQLRLNIIEQHGPQEFCPLIKGKCDRECICIGEPSIRFHKFLKICTWNVYSWYCNNEMFCGGSSKCQT